MRLHLIKLYDTFDRLSKERNANLDWLIYVILIAIYIWGAPANICPLIMYRKRNFPHKRVCLLKRPIVRRELIELCSWLLSLHVKAFHLRIHYIEINQFTTLEQFKVSYSIKIERKESIKKMEKNLFRRIDFSASETVPQRASFSIQIIQTDKITYS